MPDSCITPDLEDLAKTLRAAGWKVEPPAPEPPRDREAEMMWLENDDAA